MMIRSPSRTPIAQMFHRVLGSPVPPLTSPAPSETVVHAGTRTRKTRMLGLMHKFPAECVQESANMRASNRSKADQDPATWQPPAAAYRCTYATDWTAIKTRWSLAVDPAELAALTEVLDGCPDETIEVTLAR